MSPSSLDHLYSKSACCAVPSAIREMVVAKQFVDVATNILAQYILLEFIR